MISTEVTPGRQVNIDAQYDVIVIGAGIYGAAHAWEAASRGLSVILFDQADFGAATSANSLKSIHGGIRYLQNLNIKRVLESKRERDAYMRIEPHLVQPLAFFMPSYDSTAKGKVATAIGACLYNLLSAYDDLVSAHTGRRLRAAVVGKRRIHECLPGSMPDRINGGIRWYDGQAYDTERLVLEFVLSARQRGAHIYNYMQVKDLVLADKRVRGVVVEDRLDGREYSVHGTYVIDTTGPWLDRNHRAWLQNKAGRHALAKAVNLVYPSTAAATAFGMKLEAIDGSAAQSDRLLFAAPWRDRLIIGTWYFPTADPEADPALTAEEYELCTTDARRLSTRCGDNFSPPSLIHIGLVPVEREFRAGEFPQLTETTVVTDHGRAGGPAGLISVCGVKYTTARAAAEKTVAIIARHLGDGAPSTTNRQPLYGGDTGDHDAFCRAKLEQYGTLVDERALKNLLRSYGSAIDGVMRCAQQDTSLYDVIPGTAESIGAQVVYAVREELAQRLTDVVVRRIGVGGLGRPDAATIEYCADTMAGVAVWGNEEKADNIRELEDYYKARLG